VVEMTQDTLRTELICVVYDLYTVVLLDCRKSETWSVQWSAVFLLGIFSV